MFALSNTLPNHVIEADVDTSEEIGEKGGAVSQTRISVECDTLSALNKIGSDDNEFSGVVDDVVKVEDGSYNSEMKKDDQWSEDKADVAKVGLDYDDQVGNDATRGSKENYVKLSSQAKFSLDISSKSHESYIGVFSPLNGSSPLG